LYNYYNTANKIQQYFNIDSSTIESTNSYTKPNEKVK
jgi:hypothetical protein